MLIYVHLRCSGSQLKKKKREIEVGHFHFAELNFSS